MNDTARIEQRLRGFVAAPDDSDWQDVLRRVDVMAAATSRPGRSRPERRRRRPVLVAAVVAAAISSTGVAIAAGFGAFDGIGAAQHPEGPADALDPALVAQIDEENANLAGGPTGQMLVDSARFVRGLASGERVYALTTTTNKLCVLLVGRPGSNMSSAVGCGDPLDQDEPTTAASVQPNSATPALAYGVAVDGVTSVSFMAGGAETTVPVEKNVWAYEGPSDTLQSLTVRYADGTTQTLTDGRADAASRRSETSNARRAGQTSARPSPSSSPGEAHSTSDWRAVVNDLLVHRGEFTRGYPCTSVRLARAKVAALPHRSPYLPALDTYVRSHC